MTLKELQQICDNNRKDKLPFEIGQIIEVQNDYITTWLVYLRKERDKFVFKELIGKDLTTIWEF